MITDLKLRQSFLDLKTKLIELPSGIKAKQQQGDSFAQSLAVERWCNTEEGLFLCHIIQTFGAKTFIESGTANGYSTLWGALGIAINKAANDKSGRVGTWDAVCRPKIWDQINEFNDLVSFILPYTEKFHEHFLKLNHNYTAHPIVFFIDGDHKRNYPRRDWDVCRRIALPGDVVIFHDIFDYDAVRLVYEELAKVYKRSIVYTRNGMGVIRI